MKTVYPPTNTVFAGGGGGGGGGYKQRRRSAAKYHAADQRAFIFASTMPLISKSKISSL